MGKTTSTLWQCDFKHTPQNNSASDELPDGWRILGDRVYCGQHTIAQCCHDSAVEQHKARGRREVNRFSKQWLTANPAPVFGEGVGGYGWEWETETFGFPVLQREGENGMEHAGDVKTIPGYASHCVAHREISCDLRTQQNQPREMKEFTTLEDAKAWVEEAKVHFS